MYGVLEGLPDQGRKVGHSKVMIVGLFLGEGGMGFRLQFRQGGWASLMGLVMSEDGEGAHYGNTWEKHLC